MRADCSPRACRPRISSGGLSATAPRCSHPAPLQPQRTVSLPRELVAIADRVICHRDESVPSRLYRVLWRALDDRKLLERRTDTDTDWLMRAEKAIRRDLHKMHAFVRFRRLGEDETGRERFIAWFEPEHASCGWARLSSASASTAWTGRS